MAKNAGFCFGVERAISIAKESLGENGKVYTYGPIIHNPHVVNQLEKSGISVVNDLDNLKKGDTVIIRSHGITKYMYEEIESKEIKIIDATCPFVKKAYNAARELSHEGYSVVIFGDKFHPEVEGIISYIEGDYHIVSDINEALSLNCYNKIGYLAQTTQDRKLFQDIFEVLKNKCSKIKKVDTICNATFQRQNEAKDIAGKVDLMLIIGGRNSANTKRLYQICCKICEKTYFVESVEELKNIKFKKDYKVGISAGASTPNYLINEVLDYLNEVEYV